MDICCQDMQKGCAMDIDGVCISSKTKGDCGCDFLKPVSGLECHICKVFLRSKNDIEQHFSSTEHLKVYKVHLQSHFEHQNRKGTDQDSVNRHCLGGDQMAHGIDDPSVAGNAFKGNLVSDGRQREESEPKGNSTEQRRTRTCLNGGNRELTEDEHENLKESEPQSCNDVVAVQLPVDDAAKDQLVESASVQIVGDSSELCNTDEETGMEGSCKGGPLNIEDKKKNDVSVNRKVSATAEQSLENGRCASMESASAETAGDSIEICNTGKQIETNDGFKGGLSESESSKINEDIANCKVSTNTEQKQDNDQCAAMDTSFQLGRGAAPEIKQEEHDDDCNHDDDDDVGGIIDGFLADSDDDLLDNDDHYNRELMPAYTSDHDSRTKSTTDDDSENVLKVTSAAKSSSFADETSAFSVISSENQWPPIISSESYSNQEISGDSTSENCDATSTNDKEASLEHDEYASSNGKSTYYGKRVSAEELLPKKSTEEREKVYVASMVQYPRLYNKGKEKNITGNSNLSLDHRHKCLTCGKRFVRLQHLRRHEMIHSDERPYSCDVCAKCYKRRDDLRKHQKMHHRTEVAVQLSQGIENTTDDREMVDLFNMVQEPENCNDKEKQESLIEIQTKQSLAKPRTCLTCGKHFVRLQHLRRHETIHSNERPYSCDVCAKCYKHRDDLKKHQKIHLRICTEKAVQLSQRIEKRTEDREKVDLCDMVQDPESYDDTEQEDSMTETQATESLANPHTCWRCGKHFVKLQHLRRHETIHSNERPHSCDFCAKCYKRRDDLRKHQKIHHRTEIVAQMSQGMKKTTEDGERVDCCEIVQDPGSDNDEDKQKSIIETLRTQSLTNPRACLTCGKHFVRLQHLRRHETIHSKERPYSCDVCAKCYKHRDDLKRHQKIHLRTRTEKVFQCDICGKSFYRRYLCTKHKRTHSQEKPYSCDICGKQFKCSENLKVHKRIHTGEKPFKCDICGSSFSRSSSFAKHQRMHSGERPYACKICGKRFTASSNCREHESVHSAERPFSCAVCGKAFRCRGNLRKHEKLHLPLVKSFSCDVCGKLFRTLPELKVHGRIHTGVKPYSCNICGSSFNQRGSLKVHETKHSEERPFSCSVCGMKFKTASTRKNHKMKHTAERPYSCDTCGRVFAQSGTLNRHKRTHTKEKPYSCNVCGKSFGRSDDAKVHQKIHTRKKEQ